MIASIREKEFSDRINIWKELLYDDSNIALIIITMITKVDFSSILTLSVSIIKLVELFHSLRKQHTFRNATPGFPAK